MAVKAESAVTVRNSTGRPITGMAAGAPFAVREATALPRLARRFP